MQGQGCREVFGMFLVTNCVLGSIDGQAILDGRLNHMVASFDEITDHTEKEISNLDDISRTLEARKLSGEYWARSILCLRSRNLAMSGCRCLYGLPRHGLAAVYRDDKGDKDDGDGEWGS